MPEPVYVVCSAPETVLREVHGGNKSRICREVELILLSHCLSCLDFLNKTWTFAPMACLWVWPQGIPPQPDLDTDIPRLALHYVRLLVLCLLLNKSFICVELSCLHLNNHKILYEVLILKTFTVSFYINKRAVNVPVAWLSHLYVHAQFGREGLDEVENLITLSR